MTNDQGWTINAAKILTQGEIDLVLTDLSRRSRRSEQAFVNKVLFRLATFAGLRVSELIGLQIADVVLSVEKPYVRVRREIAKLKKARMVPLWSEATIGDLRIWKSRREAQGAGATGPLLCSLHADSFGNRIDRVGARRRFKTACRALGTERVRSITTHTGRHTFVSLSLHRGIPLAHVRSSAGHSSIATTNLYTHLFAEGESRFSID